MTKEVEQRVAALKLQGLPRITALRLIREEAEADKSGPSTRDLMLAEVKARYLAR